MNNEFNFFFNFIFFLEVMIVFAFITFLFTGFVAPVKSYSNLENKVRASVYTEYLLQKEASWQN